MRGKAEGHGCGDCDLCCNWLSISDVVVRSINALNSSLNRSRAGGEHGRAVSASHCRNRAARRE